MVGAGLKTGWLMGPAEASEASKGPYVAGVGLDGGPERWRRRIYQKKKAEMRARLTTPPTAPPAIAPVLDDFVDNVAADGEDEAKLVTDVVNVADVAVEDGCVEEGVVPVGMVVSVDSGAPASCSASATLKISPCVTFWYAQPGTAVPDGMFWGKMSK